MNLINVKKLSDFSIMLNNDIYITHNDLFKNEEATENMWCISIFDITSTQISNADILDFIEKLIESRKQQVAKNIISGPIIFYIWVDALASQLRFSFISGCEINLPFGCRLKHTNLSEIIDMFFNLTTSVEEENIDDEIKTEDDFYLKVFSICLI